MTNASITGKILIHGLETTLWGFMCNIPWGSSDVVIKAAFNTGIPFRGALSLGAISIIATVAEILFQKAINYAQTNRILSHTQANVLRSVCSIGIYAIATITPFALGIIGPTGALVLGAFYACSFAATHICESPSHVQGSAG